MKQRLCVCLILHCACGTEIDHHSLPPSPPPNAIEAPDPREPPSPERSYRWQELDADVSCSGHTATSLYDGRALIRGQCYLAGEEAWALIYEPETRSFTTLSLFAPMPPGPRMYHSATSLLDGRVLLSGGLESSTSEIFVPGSDVLIQGPSLVAERVRHASVRLADGSVMLVGDASIDHSVTAELWDTESSAFVALPPMDVPRVRPKALLLADGSVLVAGGGPPHTTRFVPETSSWVTGPLVGNPVGNMALIAPETVLLVTTSGVSLLERWETPLFYGHVPDVALAPLDDGFLLVGGSPYALPPPPAVFDPETLSLSFTLNGPAFSEATATTLRDGSALVIGESAWLYTR